MRVRASRAADGVQTRGARTRGARTRCARTRGARIGTGDAGTVTAELALGLVAVVLVLAALLVTTGASSTRMRCLDAARTAARVAALGESDAQVVAAARRIVPGARVAVVHDPPWLEVTVTSEVGGAWFTGGALTVTGSASAWVEP